MSLIHVLTTDISNKIAAGEVVERPASVVKELVENSIDAGSTRIIVEIKNGGASLISVTDNGCGMAAEDAQIAFLRHATSKISTSEDLDAIYTLGFRGEALSSVGAVSKAAIYTKRGSDDFGTVVTCEGGEIIASEEGGMSDGTKVVVRNLFYNTPARMKFLKKDATEAGYVTDVVTRFILAHPEVSFRLIKDGKDTLLSTGDKDLSGAVYAAYGKDYAKAVIPIDYTYERLHITGVAGKSSLARPNRSFQSFFVNGRYVKSPMIIRAVEEAYKNQIMIGKFPFVVINIEVNPSLIDINVHPTKLEVKFSDEKQIYDAVYYGVKNALYALPDVPKIETKHNPRENPFIKPKEQGADLRAQIEIPKPPEIILKAEPKMADPLALFRKKDKTEAKLAAEDTEYKTEIKMPKNTEMPKKAEMQKKTEMPESMPPQPEQKPKTAEMPIPNETKVREEQTERSFSVKVVGCVFNTYIIAQRDNEMLLIDQHAAHERIKYEQLLENLEANTLYPQILIEPVVVKLSGTEMSSFGASGEMLNKLGFEAEQFGESEAIVRTSPQGVDMGDVEDLFLELLSELSHHEKDILSEKQQRLLYTIACKSAVRANQALSVSEAEGLVKGVLALKNINTCPHGRPIMISMTKKEMEKQFKRIV